MMGAFPPPVGGAARVNALVRELLEAAGAQVAYVDLSGKGLAHRRGAAYHLRRLRANLDGLRTAWRAGAQDATLYLAVDGGQGRWYSLLHHLALGRRFARVVLHHHSCGYIRQSSGAVSLLARAHAARTTHVFLTPGMERAFRARYGAVRSVIASNAIMAAERTPWPEAIGARPGPRLGHLSNLCREKGFFAVADAFERTRDAGLATELRLAGPVLDDDVVPRLKHLEARYGDAVRYHGPIAGAEKDDFYRSVDLFLFPSRFAQEAAPLVVYEALAAGVPVLATDAGLIAEIVHGARGEVCREDARYADLVLRQAMAWTRGSSVVRATTIKAGFKAELDRSVEQYEELLRLIRGHG
jgi:glycosyltransferase involved in cell wall biosynthesis